MVEILAGGKFEILEVLLIPGMLLILEVLLILESLPMLESPEGSRFGAP